MSSELQTQDVQQAREPSIVVDVPNPSTAVDEPASSMAVDEPKPSTDAAVDNATDNNTSQPDEIDLLIQRAQQEHDPELWKRITEMADASGDHDKVRKAYDALLKRYPNSSFAQIAYINHFLNDQTHFGDAEDLFKKFLRMSPSVDLWKFFLTYVRRVTSGPSMRDTIRKSYEFALSHIGQDRDSADVWADYIEFIKTGPATTTWEEQQKMDALRKVYQRAIQIPLSNVERLYQEYEDFENGLNKITAKKFLADLNPSYVQAKSVLRQLTTHLSGLGLPRSDEFFLPTPPVFNEADRTLIGRWKNYLKWEEKNPLEIEDKDKAQLITRLQGVYRRAVIRMRFFPEIWFMAYTWSSKAGKNDEAETMLVAGMEANPGSYLMNFAYAELKESQKDHNAAREIFESFLALLRKEMEESEKSETPQPASANGNGNGDSGSKDSSFISLQEEAKPTSAFAQRQKEYGLAYIMYMRFAQRSEGVKASRAVFGKARRDNWVPWEVYEAAALMEYHCSSESVVASRIFESGLKKFSDDTDYIVRYLGFLISINDVNNARALFERVITNFEPERARVLWERWGRYVYQYDDLESAQKFEKRMAEVYPGENPTKRFALRHMFLHHDAIAMRDLGLAMYGKGGQNTMRKGIGNGFGSQSSQSTTQTVPAPAPSTPVPSGQKRPLSSERDRHRGDRENDRSKRPRGNPSPVRGGDRDRDRDRERDRDRDRERWGRRSPPPPPRDWERDQRPPRRSEKEKDRESGGGAPVLPPVVHNFIGQLPTASAFDGPVFRTDDLINLFRNAVIPSGKRQSPPPAPRGGARPNSDYSPYQGPGGGRTRRY